MIEFCKILIKLVLKPSSTAFVGELANFSISCMLVLPASVIYLFKKSRKQAILSGTVVGTLIMTAFGSCFNAIYLLPKFSELYGIRWMRSSEWERRSTRRSTASADWC